MNKTVLACALASILIPAVACGQEENATAEIEAIASMKNKATVRIGGNAQVGLYSGHYDQAMPVTESYEGYIAAGEIGDLWSMRNKPGNVTSFTTNNAKLDFEVSANENMSLFIQLSLDDAWSQAPQMEQDAFLEMFYFEFREILGQPLTAKIGKQPVPFGLHKDDLLLSPYIADNGNSGYSGWFNDFYGDGNWDLDGGLHPAAIDHDFAVTLEWQPKFFRDIVKIEGSVFQDKHSRGVNARNRRSDDTGLFQSYAGRLTITPFEHVNLVGSFASRYNDSAGAGKHNYIWSAGFDAKLGRLPLTLYGEYQRSWRDSWITGQDTDDVMGGVIWDISDKFRLNLQGEWMKVNRNKQAMTQWAAEYYGTPYNGEKQSDTFVRSLVAVEYDLADSFTVEGGWQREWYNRDGTYMTPVNGVATNVANFSAKGDVFYAGLKFDF